MGIVCYAAIDGGTDIHKIGDMQNFCESFLRQHMQYRVLGFQFTANSLFHVILERRADTKMGGNDRKQVAYSK